MINTINIERGEPLADGAGFGSTGSYTKLVGHASGEVDPEDAANRRIADIDKAPRNASGKVEYKADLYILRPTDPGKGNGRILYVTLNRGNKQLFQRLCDAVPDTNDLQTLEHLGNAFVLRRGYTIVWSGWDPTAPKAGARMVLQAPVATDNGRPITAVIRDEFMVGVRPRADETLKLSYEVADRDPSRCRLTVRVRQDDARRELPPGSWEFADAGNVRLLPAGTRPQDGMLYEFEYTARNPPVMGLGFAATRDVVSYLRYEPNARDVTGRAITHVFAIGFSQGGRYLRNHISEGFNRDEAGRRVFDGVLAHTAGVGRVFLNERFSQPFRTCTLHEDHYFPENVFPFSAAAAADPITGRSGSLFRGDGSDPMLMLTNTATEYWQKGASLLHTDALGAHDLELPPNCRVYMIAGTQHGGRGNMASKRTKTACNPNNAHSPMPVLRALLSALDEWVVSGTKPPDSKIPTLASGSLVAPDATGFPPIPDAAIARETNRFGPPEDWVHPKPPARFYRPLVCKVDADGNEVAGVRTPDVTVPIGTSAGWNIYKAPFPEGVLADRTGSFIPFAATRDEREKKGDPRPSLEERYRDRADYAARVKAAADALVRDRLLLPEDAVAYAERAKNG